MNRDEAWTLVTQHTRSESLRRHMLAVEASMRAYARRLGGDVERWGLLGLIHDFDYEEHPDMDVPDGHPKWGVAYLRSNGLLDEELIRAIEAHGWPRVPVQPESSMEWALVAVDELTGFLTAVALVRPTKDIRDITKIKSVKDKWKDKAFAAAVNREEIAHAAGMLGVDLWEEHVPLVLQAMQDIAAELGLDGSAAA
jgi:putative nucleotidyltransferase with HDIG domain